MRALVWAVLATVGCVSDSPDPAFEIRPEELHLAPVAWIDTSTDWSDVSILNTTYFSLEITSAQIVATTQDDIEGGGDTPDVIDSIASAADFLELGALVTEARQIPIRASTTVSVRVTPPDPAVLVTWSEASFQATLRLTIGGTGKIDPTTGEADIDGWKESTVEIPIFMETRCDLDGDQYEARECGGSDCDDFLQLVNIEAVEDCDGFDNNCNGVADEDCPDLDL
ncbi:MAG TPA: putative metal-binding motif-containing protein [Myxococcota bacterium]|nr:putative metal-binding motif-containing protein [Myxococcota bacterium]